MTWAADRRTPLFPLLLLGALSLCCLPALAEKPAIAVLDFELNDLTPLPGGPEEVSRAAAIRGLVETALRETGKYEIRPVDDVVSHEANVSFGYLYDHPDKAAALGRGFGADWILVGRLHKPSFLFAYLMGRLVETRSGDVIADLVVEAKGQTEPVTRRGAIRLAKQVDTALDLELGLEPAPP
ncbi:DUF2380 domain-containing protein [Thiorhodococcus minor]|uniref:DUF2380 domain-containing protein n=1 Tax=Thiorhodococcus minor TaxID=57489 RepID=A0A6M0K5U3_9GAMM|nr:DUF2380 domain-containing protein [Thiorhodococcus minor]NEV63967.1 DUF2380 domain-containing protein [Thiorhodococcus minor]